LDQLPKISFLISGYGTNLKVILEKILKDKQKKFFILGIISNNNIDNNIKEKSLKINKKIKIYENVKKLNNLHLKNSNLIFSLGYMKLIPPNIIKNFFIINLHPSLLPLYKGLMTHRRMLINNELKCGFSIHKVNNKLDEGEVLFQKSFKIKTKNEIQLIKNHKNFEHKNVYDALKKIIFKL
tara:strand:- start:504 stop:1049 length:546 start_codon:yes stop_codon:yes gene_type:complete